MAKAKTLQQHIASYWLLSGVIAVLASLMLFSVFGYYNYRNETRVAEANLKTKAEVAARRISGELLIAPRGAPEAVALQLQKDLSLSDIRILKSNEDIRPLKKSGMLYKELPMPFLSDQYKLLAAVPSVELRSYFKFELLIFSIVLIGLIVGAGLILQTRYIKKHLVRPIESLVETSTGEKVVCEGWPLELQEISHKLSASFQQREQVVYSQIAKGVIHDIKTILQSLKVASDLADENPNESRLKNLLHVNKAKLPSLLSIIDTTLDGSREITVLPTPADLSETMKRSIETSKLLPVAKDISILFEHPTESLLIAHDSTQLERVFTNLLKNALESVSEKNAEDKTVKVAFNLSEKDFVGITVEDSGLGLPKQADSVFRVLKSTKRHGSGLGLTVSKKIVEAHSGKISASNSTELKGARFEVRLPREKSV